MLPCLHLRPPHAPRRPGRPQLTRVRRAIGVVVVGAIIGAVVVVAWTTWRIWDVGNHDDRRPVDAIVVLGAAQYNGRPSAVLKARLDHGIDLYRAGLAPYLVVTGGKAEGDRTTEAASPGRTPSRRASRTGRSSSRTRAGRPSSRCAACAEILRDHRLDTALFVSDRTHMLRVLRIARDEGIASFGSPTDVEPVRRDLGAGSRPRSTSSAGSPSTSWPGRPCSPRRDSRITAFVARRERRQGAGEQRSERT